MPKCIFFFLILLLSYAAKATNSLNDDNLKKETITIVVHPAANKRTLFGANKITKALEKVGYKVQLQTKYKSTKNKVILIGQLEDDFIKYKLASQQFSNVDHLKKEGFSLQSDKNTIVVTGADASGSLYGCLALADSIVAQQMLPQHLEVIDAPQMVLRGTCVGIQKTAYLPGRTVYEYPYTPETFPWLYDKGLWIQYLDSLVANRYNSLYLWNGHPFASLVRLKDYPYAVEVSDETFKKNEEMYRFLTEEADKRGIWVIQMFYNIIVSKPFAEKHGLKTQDRTRPITPLIADYTRKSIAAFVEKYPNVGLLITLGEAMEELGQMDIDWFTKTIIPGVQDGLKALGKSEEPPIVLRAHDTDAPAVMQAALPLYKNLYTMAKYNGEALTTYTPRGPWAELHRKLSRIGTVQVENVHILANLEPFRYGSPDFIQKSVQAMHQVYEANALHLYPQASYWDWPYTADKTQERLLQIERDWIWYKAWARYAWNADRKAHDEKAYWSEVLSEKFGTDVQAGQNILKAYEESGEIAPKLLRRFGITDGNRQTLTLGMLMTQLINPYRYNLFKPLYDSEAPEGEKLIEYAEKEWKQEKHIGETPVHIIQEVRQHGKAAMEAIESAGKNITINKEEFARLKTDMHIYNALAHTYAYKAEAALFVLNYKYTHNISELQKAQEKLSESLAYFKQLVKLTEGTYLYANSMQTGQRKIPVSGSGGNNKTWAELLPVYEKELTVFSNKVDSLKAPVADQTRKASIFKNADVQFENDAEFFIVNSKASIYKNDAVYIHAVAKDLELLKGIKLNKADQIKGGTTIKFRNTKPVKVLVGYLDGASSDYLKAPQLENDASANDYGQAEALIRNAVQLSDTSIAHIHAYSFAAGENLLKLGKGAVLILGIVPDDIAISPYDAGIGTSETQNIDWLFE